MIIGITGKSGDGKTTAANILNNLVPDSIVINVDEYQVPMLLKSKELINLYGSHIINNGTLNVRKFLENDLCFRKIHEVTKNRVMICLLNKIREYQENYKTIIIEWVRLPELNDIWDLCDYHILVKSFNRKKRYENIIKRNRDIGYFLKDMNKELRLRDKNNLKYDEYLYDYIIENQYDDNFKIKIESIVEGLMKNTYKENDNKILCKKLVNSLNQL